MLNRCTCSAPGLSDNILSKGVSNGPAAVHCRSSTAVLQHQLPEASLLIQQAFDGKTLDCPATPLASGMLQPEALALHYSRFKVTERLLFTGHSHQAWPDCSFEAQQRAWLDAADLVDGKWAAAGAEVNRRVRAGFAELLDDSDGEYSLGGSTHDLLVRWLSALPFHTRQRLVTTDCEFYSADRQFRRLQEEGVEVVWLPAHPAHTVGARLAAAVDDRTAAVFVSAVFFKTGHIAGGLAELAATAAAYGAELMVDTYHALGAIPFSIQEHRLQNAYLVGGGYKYLQLGEGNCFLRYPPACRMRPVFTGWYADFEALLAGGAGASNGDGSVQYASAGGARFAGATYDLTSRYRAAAVLDFFQQQGMTPEALRELNQAQLQAMRDGFAAQAVDPAVLAWDESVPMEQIGAFASLKSPIAGKISGALEERGMRTDFRGDCLRLGPAPYTTFDQITRGMQLLGEVALQLGAEVVQQ